MTDVYSNLLKFLDTAKDDSSEVLTGKCLLFPDVNVEDNELVMEDAETDSITILYNGFLSQCHIHLRDR